MAETFTAELIRGNDKDTMGIEVPPEIVERLGSGKRPRVTIRFEKTGYSYSYTIASMGGRFLLGIAKEHREPAGIKNQKAVKVTLALDDKPREVEVPKDLAKALTAGKVRKQFDALSYTNRKEAVRLVESAKQEATRERRIAKIVDQLANQ
ncbi:MAG: DUF1905 domain-containing protein [Bacteroidetes bacterium]|nr:DUF1905 domain-containing protein [Bacteroidota bacterium]